MPLRQILEAELFDVSPVTYPAYRRPRVSARGDGVELRGAAIEGRSRSPTVSTRCGVCGCWPQPRQPVNGVAWDNAERLMAEREGRRLLLLLGLLLLQRAQDSGSSWPGNSEAATARRRQRRLRYIDCGGTITSTLLEDKITC